MVKRKRLPRIRFSPFKTEQEELLDRFIVAVKSGNTEEAQRLYKEMKHLGLVA